MKNRRLKEKVGAVLSAFFCLCLTAALVAAQTKTPEKLTETTAANNLTWRSIGPANMGDPNTVYVATGAGGILWRNALRISDLKLHLYGKAEERARAGKLGI